MVSLKKKCLWAMLPCCACAVLLAFAPVKAAPVDSIEINEEMEDLVERYQKYQESFAAIETVDDIEANGYEVIENQSFPVLLECFGEEEVIFYPIMEKQYHRLAVLIADADGRVLFKTNQLETNNKCLGQLEQPTKDIAAVSFQDANNDGLTDIILITNCENETGSYAGKPYKIGDVLFQRGRAFYRDWRISDKINRFSMNKSVDFILSHVRDGNSTEVLYTAATLEELLENGFQIITANSYYHDFEKQGRLKLVPGIIRMAEYDVFMLYLVNEQGYIVWSFQPMEDYDNLYALRGAACKDLDGDGLKDIVILGRYSYEGPNEELLIDVKCDIYYQRTDGFSHDTEFADYYQCTEEDTVAGLVDIIREYWGWKIEE